MGRPGEALALMRLLLRHAAIYFSLGFIACLLEGLIEQPKPDYGPEVTWLELRVQGSAVLGALVAAVAVVAIAANILHLHERKVPHEAWDVAYYPRLKGFWELRRHPRSRRVLLAASLLLVCYWTWCLYENIIHRFYFYRHGWFWPPSVFQMTILVTWGALWLAEVLNRPTRQVLPVCITYWVVLVLNWGMLGCDTLIE